MNEKLSVRQVRRVLRDHGVESRVDAKGLGVIARVVWSRRDGSGALVVGSEEVPCPMSARGLRRFLGY